MVNKMVNFVDMLINAVLIMAIIKWPLIESFHHVGETSPLKVEAIIGSDFNITCYMNPNLFDGKNCNSLYFDDGRTNEIFPLENIIIVNRTSIVYEVRNAAEQDTKYRCKCGSVAIMQTRVFVGTLPKPITDFTCRSYHFEYMVCNFTKPINPVGTQYNITFYTTSAKYIYTPDCSASADGVVVVCNTSFHNYRPRDEYYHFRINAENALGKMQEQEIDVNNWDVMIPAKPGEDMQVEVFVDSINVAWRMTKWEDYRLKGLEWEVLVLPDNFTVIVCKNPVRPDKYGLVHLSVTNLPYPYWAYKLMIRVKVNASNSIWSEQLVYSFKTNARPPDRPPRLLPGSFNIDSMETSITIYWEQLAPYEYNGYNFSYIIANVYYNGKFANIKPTYLDLNRATFMWNKDSHYEFEIRSHNHKGFSNKASRLIINPLGLVNVNQYSPKAIHNVYHAVNKTYTLSWKAPIDVINLLSYTVYWCYEKRSLPNECRGSMHFQQLPPSQLNFTIENSLQEQTLNLAVSADYSHINTGLHWTECSGDVNIDLVKMEPDVQATSATSVKVHWSVEGVCHYILDGFNLSYCEVSTEHKNESTSCLEDPITKILAKELKRYEITELKPYTTYNITMFMFSRLKRGRNSDVNLVRTLEGTPSPPRQLQVFQVTNTSATIKWQPPSQQNGILRNYTIILNTDKYEVNASVLEYKLMNLTGFTAYKVYVLAHTLYSSMPSNDVHFTTLIGYPSPPGHASNSNNASQIQWTKPLNPRGYVEFYEVNITLMRNNERIKSYVSVVMGDTSCNFKVSPCLSHEYKTIVEVRAVNVASSSQEGNHQVNNNISQTNNEKFFNDTNGDDDDLLCKGGRLDKQSLQDLHRYYNSSHYHLYKSAWKSMATYACSSTRLSKVVTIVLLIVVMSFVMMIGLYMMRRIYNRMANINCTLPAGLDLYFTKDTTSNFGGNGGGCGVHSLGVSNVTSKILNSAAKAAEEQWLVTNSLKKKSHRNEHHYLLDAVGQDSEFTLSSSLETTQISDEHQEKLQQHFQVPNLSSCHLKFSSESLNKSDNDCKEISQQFENDNNFGNISVSLADSTWQNFRDANAADETETFKNVVNADTRGCITAQNSGLKSDNGLEYNLSNNNSDITKQKKTTTLPSMPSNNFNDNAYTTVAEWCKIAQNLNNENYNVVTSGYVTQQDLNIFVQNHH